MRRVRANPSAAALTLFRGAHAAMNECTNDERYIVRGYRHIV